MNHAATKSRGAILWFVHADSRVTADAVHAIHEALADPRTVGGSFRFQVDSPRRVFRWIERAVDWRTRWLRTPYGDQGLFVRRDTFERLGGFAEEPILEDLYFVRAMRRTGRLAALPQPLRTSARRWDKAGVVRTTLRHQKILLLERLGVSTTKLAGYR